MGLNTEGSAATATVVASVFMMFDKGGKAMKMKKWIAVAVATACAAAMAFV